MPVVYSVHLEVAKRTPNSLQMDSYRSDARSNQKDPKILSVLYGFASPRASIVSVNGRVDQIELWSSFKWGLTRGLTPGQTPGQAPLGAPAREPPEPRLVEQGYPVPLFP